MIQILEEILEVLKAIRVDNNKTAREKHCGIGYDGVK